MKAVSARLLLAVLATAASTGQVSARVQENRPGAVIRWEYRVVTKDQLLELGQKDLTAGLNKLGGQGWELVGVEGVYVFKRPRDQMRIPAAEIKRRINALVWEVVLLRERVDRAERMRQQGYLTEGQMAAERLRLREAQAELEQAREALKALPPERKTSAEVLPMPAK
jgi:hypothetical protein